ncbi:MAG TPA: hypothetical protein VF155_03480 [Candidatus Dormibacteraeota bacterium]
MFAHHRLLAGAGLIAAVIAVVIALRAGTAPQGASLTWGPAPSAGAAPGVSAASAAPSGIPVPQASPGPSPASSPLGGLQLPLSVLFQQLNSETRNTAIGQSAILRDIGDAIRDRVTGFLNSVTAGR